jgi:hypothetical protein
MWRRILIGVALAALAMAVAQVQAAGRGAAMLEQLRASNADICRAAAAGPVESLIGALAAAVNGTPPSGGTTLRYPATMVNCPRPPVKPGVSLLGYVLEALAAEPIITRCNTSELAYWEDKNATDGSGYWYALLRSACRPSDRPRRYFNMMVLVPLEGFVSACSAPADTEFADLLKAEIDARALKDNGVAAAAATGANASSLQ